VLAKVDALVMLVVRSEELDAELIKNVEGGGGGAGGASISRLLCFNVARIYGEWCFATNQKLAHLSRNVNTKKE
jgi:hypothetical protein